jgi:hypothetical protein
MAVAGQLYFISVFTENHTIQHAVLLIVKADGTYSYHSALNYLSVHYNRSLQIDHI